MRLRTIVKMAAGCNFISYFPFLLGLLILTPVIKCLTPLEKTGLFIQGYMPMINITELMVLESSTSNPDRELFEGVDFTGYEKILLAFSQEYTRIFRKHAPNEFANTRLALTKTKWKDTQLNGTVDFSPVHLDRGAPLYVILDFQTGDDIPVDVTGSHLAFNLFLVHIRDASYLPILKDRLDPLLRYDTTVFTISGCIQ